MIAIKRIDGTLIESVDVKTVIEAVEILVMKGVDLAEADLAEANLEGAKLAGAKLASADLNHARMSEADMSGADLSDANLDDAKLSFAKLIDAHLVGASMIGTYLYDADITGADIDYAAWPLWCGSSDLTIDERQAKQLLAHALILAVGNGFVSKDWIIGELIDYANEFHRIESGEFPKIAFD